MIARRRLGSLVLLGIALRLLWSLALGPVTTMAVAFLVARKGRYSFGNNDILAFLLSPTGVITLVLAATLFVFASTIELASLLVLGGDRVLGGSPFARSSMRTLRATPRLFALAGRQCLVLFVLAVPFLGLIGAAYLLLWSDYDLYFLVKVRPPKFWIGAGIAGSLVAAYLAVASIFFVRWIYSVPAVLFESESSRGALRSSARRVMGSKKRVAWIALAWLAGTLAIQAATVAILRSFSLFVLERVGDSVAFAVITAAGLLALDAVVISVVGFLTNAVGAFLLLQLYTGPAEDADHPPLARWMPSRLAILGTTAGIASVAIFLSFGLVASLGADDDILITAHRGVHDDATENTVAAVKEAAKIGVPWAEIDVQLSKDNVVVVAHDEDLMRLAGLNRKIRDMTAAELGQVSLPWKTSTNLPGEHVPTLEEVIDAVKGQPLKIMVEIKVYSGDNVPRLVSETVDLIRRKGFGDQCMVISLSYDALGLVRKQDPDLRLGYLVAEAIGNVTRLDVDELSVRFALATPLLVAEATSRDKPIAAWTVNDPAMMVRLWDRGVANIVTSDPRRMMARREEVLGKNKVERLLLRARYLLGG